MIRSLVASCALTAMACACSPAPAQKDAPDSPAAETAAAPAAEETILPADATGFITATPLPLAEDGSVRRDDYGRPYEYAFLGKKLPHFTGTMLDGSTFDSDDLTQWTVIDVWGLWCSDCQADAPYAAALSTAINQDPDLDFLSIHVPASAARATPEEMYKKYGSVDAYFAEKGYSYPVVIDSDASLRDTLRIDWTPSYLLVSPDGVVKGYRSEFSAAKGEPVKDFLKDVARVKAEQQQ
nr:TlpA disulfide reductase family protein [uncultured Hyphomonas sp.]